MRKIGHRVSRFVSIPVLVAAIGCGSSPSTEGEAVGTANQAITMRDARVYLTASVLQRLEQRASAADPAWTALKSHCDGLTGGTFNVPNQNAYPNFPDVGQGYEGDGYLPEVMSLGLCYRVASGIGDASAAAYGTAGASLLEVMATPAASGGQAPSTDDGYGIRNYGVGMATGFDWLYPALSASNITDVVSALNSWVGWFDTSGFCNSAPIANYFQGYLLAKTATAIGTAGDNASASTYWSDVQTNLWAQLVEPQFLASMSGGGWPEGWEYGPLAVEEYTQFLWAAETGEQLDWSSQVPNARDEAAYITYFAWPSLQHMDDQGTIHAMETALAPPAVTMAYLSAILQSFGDPYAPTARSATAAMMAASTASFAPYQSFLYWDPSLSQADYTQQPLSYFASGPNHVAVRSSWATDAVWGTFVSGAYIDSPDSGEQLFNQGAVAVVVGDQPILVNPTGWLPQVESTAGENLVYADAWGNETRLLANTFFEAGTKQGTEGPGTAKTHVIHYEDGNSYVRARGVNIEDMYMSAGAVTQFTRDYVYLRPGNFVVYDRTTVADGTADQWTAWHTPTVPALVATTDATQRRYDISANGGVVGSVRSLLPSSAASRLVNVMGTVTRIENHTPAPASQTDWLTVVSAGASVPDQVRLSTSDGNVTTGAAVGVLVLAARNGVVLFSDDHAAVAQLSAVTYAVAQTATADHVLVDVAPASSGYAITATVSGGVITVEVKPGGTFQPTGEGTLAFAVALDGTVTVAAPPISGDSGVPSGCDSGVPGGQDAAIGKGGAGRDGGHARSRDAGSASSSGSTCDAAHAGAPDAGAAAGGSTRDGGHRGAADSGLPGSDSADQDGSTTGDTSQSPGGSQGGGCSTSGGRPHRSDLGGLALAALVACAGARRRSRLVASSACWSGKRAR
jgi:hypothetical protein